MLALVNGYGCFCIGRTMTCDLCFVPAPNWPGLKQVDLGWNKLTCNTYPINFLRTTFSLTWDLLQFLQPELVLVKYVYGTLFIKFWLPLHLLFYAEGYSIYSPTKTIFYQRLQTFLVESLCLIQNHQFIVFLILHENFLTFYNMTVIFLQS